MFELMVTRRVARRPSLRRPFSFSRPSSSLRVAV
jgi:hypothetical protein